MDDMDKAVKAHFLRGSGKHTFPKGNATMNMTEGRPLALLSVFALPLLIGNLFQQAYNLADSMIVGRLLGADALAAVGATGSISFLFFSIFNGISGGCGRSVRRIHLRHAVRSGVFAGEMHRYLV
jgi:Na+-driven multidrug efflux pump